MGTDQPITAMLKIGLISDTHMPLRLKQIPPAVFDIFADVDLILHAGDVGELWVLDILSAIAPVIAVHGNDDFADTIRELPYKQIVAANGQRILLWHSHVPDRPTELALRAGNTWKTIQHRLALTAKQAGATTVIYGHTHVAMVSTYNGIDIINPGAIAPGNLFTQQRVQSVAVLTVEETRPQNRLTHYDLSDPTRPWKPPVDLSASFDTAFKLSERMILSTELQSTFLRRIRGQLHLNDIESVVSTISPLSFACWDGEIDEITRPMLIDLFTNATAIDAADRQTILQILHQSPPDGHTSAG